MVAIKTMLRPILQMYLIIKLLVGIHSDFIVKALKKSYLSKLNQDITLNFQYNGEC